VFQDFALLPWGDRAKERRVRPAAAGGVPAAERAERARGVIARVGLAGFEQAYPAQLSGGCSSAWAWPARWP